MRKEEAIDIIRQYECCNEHTEACEMAIKALKAEPVKRGKWEESPTGWIACSVCGNEPHEQEEIIRCADCKYCELDYIYVCQHRNGAVKLDGFCDRGERREP